MHRARSWWWLAVAVLAGVSLASPLPPGLLTARAQTGGTVVIGLDQEPPTLDPHASPSAVTYQIIASVTENLLFRGPDGKLVPWLAESWEHLARWPQRDLQAPPRRQVPRRDALQRGGGQVQF
jgi:ABC-type transport system substrate-binding protein